MLSLLFLSFLLLGYPLTIMRVKDLRREGSRGRTLPDQKRSAWTLPEIGSDKEATGKSSKTTRQTEFRRRFHITNVSYFKKLTDEDSERGLEAQSGRNRGITKKGTLSGDAPHEKHPSKSEHGPSSSQHSAVYKIPPADIEGETHTLKNGQLNLREPLQRSNSETDNSALCTENEWLVQAVLHLNYFDNLILSVLSTLTSVRKKAVAALPENMRPGPDLYGFPWEAVICGAVLVSLLICQVYLLVRSRLSLARQKQLGNHIAELIEEKCQLLEKLGLRKEEYEELESSLKDLNLWRPELSTTRLDLKTEMEKLESFNSALENKIERLEKQLEEEKIKGLDDLQAKIQKTESCKNEARAIELQLAEGKNILKVYEMNRERLEKSLQDARVENAELRESEKQLLQELEGWKERVGQLSKQAKVLESSTGDMEEALKDKESQVQSLAECLLKMADWSCVTEEEDEGNYFNNERNAETENGEDSDDQGNRTIRKLVHAVMLSARLKSLETERNQIDSKLADEKKAKKELAECMESLQKKHLVIQSENEHLESEVRRLQWKLEFIQELYQEMGRNLHRKLTVEAKERLQREEQLTKLGKSIDHAVEESNTYRQMASDLKEELERTVHFYQSEVMVHEKKAYDNLLSACAAESFLNDTKFENAKTKEKLVEAECQYELLKKRPLCS